VVTACWSIIEGSSIPVSVVGSRARLAHRHSSAPMPSGVLPALKSVDCCSWIGTCTVDFMNLNAVSHAQSNSLSCSCLSRTVVFGMLTWSRSMICETKRTTTVQVSDVGGTLSAAEW
jgi:hypothetical protein